MGESEVRGVRVRGEVYVVVAELGLGGDNLDKLLEDLGEGVH